MDKIVFEGLLEHEAIEDLGQAQIARLDDPNHQELFIRFQSWIDRNDDLPEDVLLKHEQYNRFVNKKVRVTVEVVD